MKNVIKSQLFRTIMIVFLSLLSGFLYAIALVCLINKEGVNMLSNGFGGISLISARLFGRIGLNESVVYSVVHIIINIPVIILAYKRIGKMYTLYTLVDMLAASLFVSIVGNAWPEMLNFLDLDPASDKLMIAVLAGILIGVSSGIAFRNGFSTGGIDTLIAYIGIKTNKQVGIFSSIINAIILLVGGLIFKDWNALLYTLVMIFITSLVIDALYIRAKKRMIKIITTKKDEVTEALIKNSKHGITVSSCEGGYSHSQKFELETCVLAEEVKNLINIVKEVDSSCFIYVINVYDIVGNYTMPNFK